MATWRGPPYPTRFRLEPPSRLRMVDDLLRQHRLVEQPRADIIALIGEPDETPYFRRYDLMYHLGAERRAFGIDCEWLVIRLGPDGVATEARVAAD